MNAQIALIIIWILNLGFGLGINDNGKSFASSLGAIIFYGLILWWGGFWSPLFR
jgi:hypothetical protein